MATNFHTLKNSEMHPFKVEFEIGRDPAFQWLIGSHDGRLPLSRETILHLRRMRSWVEEPAWGGSFASYVDNSKVVFAFSDEKTAILFKLTWC